MRRYNPAMCLIFLAWKQHADYPLVVAANRDEFYARPTARADFWEDAPGMLAGRDLSGGGTWLGVTRDGRFAALTNYRGGAVNTAGAPTRGRLVSDFLLSDAPPEAYLDELQTRADEYNGFNLVVGDREGLHWYSNRGGMPSSLTPGVYGVSNALLDTPWPKVERGKEAFAGLLGDERIGADALFELLEDRTVAADHILPDTGIGLHRERALSPIYIETGDYGTRSSTVLLIGADGAVDYHERTHAPGSDTGATLTYAFRIERDREPVY